MATLFSLSLSLSLSLSPALSQELGAGELPLLSHLRPCLLREGGLPADFPVANICTRGCHTKVGQPGPKPQISIQLDCTEGHIPYRRPRGGLNMAVLCF